jgi:DNA/RNA endonuclease G (NUC1)
MKKLILLLLLPIMAGAQTVKHVYPGFTTYWNTKTLIPDSVIYIAKPHKKVAPRLPSFHVVGAMLNENRDYAHSGYDQGHLCNASDENGSIIDEYNSFGQDNIFPQTPQDNRLVWLAIENYVRKLAVQYRQVKVKIYWQGVAGYMGVDKVVIPGNCIKEIWYNGKHEKYIVPNTTTVNKQTYTYYLVK